MFDQFQPRLLINHLFVNAPVQQTPLQNPVNVFVNPLTGGTLTNNTPDTSMLATHVGAVHHTPAPATPVPAPSPKLPQRNLCSPDFDYMKAVELRRYANKHTINLHDNKRKSAIKRIIREHEIERKTMS